MGTDNSGDCFYKQLEKSPEILMINLQYFPAVSFHYGWKKVLL